MEIKHSKSHFPRIVITHILMMSLTHQIFLDTVIYPSMDIDVCI